MDADLENTRSYNTGTTLLNSQTIAKKLGKTHTTAKANRKQKWLRTTCLYFDMQNLRTRIEIKYKHIEDAEERKRIISQEAI
jgi:hypothetical protein